MNDTPRTNAAMFSILSHLQSGVEFVVKASVCRDIERELDQTQRRVAELETELKDVNEELRGHDEALRETRARIAELEAERDTLKAAIATPAAVWVNMLRGTIARPQALDHYEACKARVEKLEAEREDLLPMVDAFEKAIIRIAALEAERDRLLKLLKEHGIEV